MREMASMDNDNVLNSSEWYASKGRITTPEYSVPNMFLPGKVSKLKTLEIGPVYYPFSCMKVLP